MHCRNNVGCPRLQALIVCVRTLRRLNMEQPSSPSRTVIVNGLNVVSSSLKLLMAQKENRVSDGTL